MNLTLEIPSTPDAFSAGLMFRESLDKNSGMLFVFKEAGEKSFHMTNTTIPLDIAFINEDGIIESIKELKPLDETHVFSDAKVLYAIEVNRGWFTENNIQVGDSVDDIEFVEEGAAWTKKAGKNKSGGLNEKGRKSYEKENPGSDLKAPSKKVGNPRRKSFCARMKGMRKRQKPSNNTGDDRLSKSLRAWNCGYEPEGNSILESLKDELLGDARKKHAAAGKKKFKDFRSQASAVKEKGVKFYDKKGTGRIVDGKKVYKR